ncbi:SAV_2336 N-terminal domain-related protein [Streptomyces justiciae]|uniref:SAV_2336 N-terminal domain-related protein n=1 Tax=Streptomyces justiciae TaxID=2780140 RepID=A0ABU3LZ62_9ACTN|nr:SAV_2336 N-terminal domain-related protein [Streptomyces justiciae]MDT7844546.1 SAV_2336 N-terminal domain-related protein [Streptomyces justiciae]
MASEEAGEPLARLTRLLGAASPGDDGPTPRELAELLWLARELEGGADHEDADRTITATPARETAPKAETAAHPEPPAPLPEPPAHPPGTEDNRVPLRLPPPRSAPASRPLLAPAPPMLHHPLALQRALRPLKRRVPAPRRKILDEAATADRIARLGAHPDVWLPVLRPAPDRWLHLNLVYDAGPTMPIWRPLVRELHAVLAQSGVFRTVTLHRATPDGRAHGVPVAADGRTVTLVVSDGMGPQWRPGPAGDRWYRTLRRWAHGMPLAAVQPLPELLWHTTALPATPGLLTAPSPAAPTSLLTFTPYAPDTAPGSPSSGAVPLPVLEPGPTWLANWSSLVADPGGGRVPGAVAWLDESPVPPSESSAPDIASLPPRDLVLHFRSTASPEAFRLAGHLSLAVPSLPVMRLVQRVLDHQPRPQHLAEVILSGMLTTVPGPPGSYEFRPGVRDLLQRTLPRTARGRTREFLARVGGLIDERAGLAAGEFRAEAGDGGSAFATVSEETVRRLGGGAGEEGVLLGGRYRVVGVRGTQVWEAVDVRDERPVLVHEYAEQTDGAEIFAAQAEVLAGVRHPNVIKVLDYWMEGTRPYLVTECVVGVTVTELERGSGPGVSTMVLDRIRQGVESGLAALHEHRLVRGGEGWDGVLLRPDGTAVISRFTLGRQSVRHSAQTDVRAFEVLLNDLVARRRPYSEPLRVGMLGPLRVNRGPIRSPEAQAMLCVLLLERGRRMSSAELARGIWDEPPPNAPGALGDLAQELRNRLGPGTLAELPDGYAVHPPDVFVDVLYCLDLLAPDLDPVEARRALNLWYGDEPLADVPGPAARAARSRWDLLRLAFDALAAGKQSENVEERATVDFEIVGAEDPHAHALLGQSVTGLLARGDLVPHDYEVRTRDNGYLVVTEPHAYVLPVLVAVLRGLPEELDALPDTPRVRVTFWHTRAPGPPDVGDLVPRTDAKVTVLVSPPLHEEYVRSSAASDSRRFEPLRTGTESDPVAWYCSLRLPSAEPEGDPRDLVRGPFTTWAAAELAPDARRTALVFAPSDGPLALTPPALTRGRPTRYYEVDLTIHRATHQVTLPSSGRRGLPAEIDLSWHVTGPMAFVLSEITNVSEVLLDHVLKEAGRITRRHNPARVGAAQQALHAALREWPVPGLSVSCSVRLLPAPEESPAAPRTRRAPTDDPIAAHLRAAETVLIGFDGPLTRLFTSKSARAAAMELIALAVENRDPEEALQGRPLTPALKAPTHPLEVLRAFASSSVGPTLRRRLDELELRAVPHTHPTPHVHALIRALTDAGRNVEVVTDVCEQAAQRVISHHGLPLTGVHGRSDDLAQLMPNPDCLLRALAHTGRPSATGLLISSSTAELIAASRLGFRAIAFADIPATARRLREGPEILLPSLEPVLDAARTL